MCGITGLISRTPIGPSQVDLVARMNAIQTHRGPDGAGEYHDQHFAMAMRRLSIIDLSTGWQPLYNEDRSLVLICNGEIYNFVELRQQLERKGHRFSTKSDCETILHLYEDHRDDCVQHLRGMFAFALWDTKQRRLLVARDRLGEKPLYLAEKDGSVTFSSELKALLRSGVVPFELDPDAINLYFHYRYVPEPFVPVKGVRKLPAAHLLTVEVDPWRVEERCYWRMEDAPPLEGDPAKIIRAELDRIAELIIRSDVPVGIALSAGIDSGAIACLTAAKYPGTMHAITVGYTGEPLQDERPGARALAAHLKMPIHEVELSTGELIDYLRDVHYHRDDPMSDNSGISYFAVMRKARELNLPVMLSGFGGDEMFWGYAWVRRAVEATRRKQLLRSGGAVGLRDYLSVNKPPYSYTGAVRWMQSLGGLRSGWRQYQRDKTSPIDQMVFYDSEVGFIDAAARVGKHYTPSFAQSIHSRKPYELFSVPQPWPRLDIAVTRLICDTYMAENGIAQGDRLSMATSIELRLPLLDYRLVETVIGLRKAREDHHLPPKHWFREAIKDVVPEFVLNKRKRGFSTPWRVWNKALSEAYAGQLKDGYLVNRGILTPKSAAWMSRQIKPRPFMLPVELAMTALMLEMWCRQMDDGRQS